MEESERITDRNKRTAVPVAPHHTTPAPYKADRSNRSDELVLAFYTSFTRRCKSLLKSLTRVFSPSCRKYPRGIISSRRPVYPCQDNITLIGTRASIHLWNEAIFHRASWYTDYKTNRSSLLNKEDYCRETIQKRSRSCPSASLYSMTSESVA